MMEDWSGRCDEIDNFCLFIYRDVNDKHCAYTNLGLESSMWNHEAHIIHLDVSLTGLKDRKYRWPLKYAWEVKKNIKIA
jgi:hypothetical protein